MTVHLPPQDAAGQLSAVAADLAAALADEESAPLAPVMLLDRACELLDRLSWAMCREPAGFPLGGLREIARGLAADLRADSRETLTGDEAADLQAAAVTAQASDFTAAYRRWAAAGRPGTRRGPVEDEVAHLLITTAIFAEMTGIDVDKAIGRKVTVTRSRGIGDQAAGQAGPKAGEAAALAPAGVGKS